MNWFHKVKWVCKCGTTNNHIYQNAVVSCDYCERCDTKINVQGAFMNWICSCGYRNEAFYPHGETPLIYPFLCRKCGKYRGDIKEESLLRTQRRKQKMKLLKIMAVVTPYLSWAFFLAKSDKFAPEDTVGGVLLGFVMVFWIMASLYNMATGDTKECLDPVISLCKNVLSAAYYLLTYPIQRKYAEREENWKRQVAAYQKLLAKEGLDYDNLTKEEISNQELYEISKDEIPF